MVAPLVGAAIASGAAQVVGGWMGGKGASRAAKSQALAQQQALNYQRSRDAIADQRYTAKWDDYKTRYSAWEARQPGYTAPASGGGGGGAAAGPQTLGDIAGMQASMTSAGLPATTATDATAGSLSDLAKGSDWTDWRRYGAGVQ